jgi:hypothetical protein
MAVFWEDEGDDTPESCPDASGCYRFMDSSLCKKTKDGAPVSGSHVSCSLLPERRIAAAMEASNDRECFIRLNDKHDRVGKAAKQGAAYVLVDYWELPGGDAYSLNRSVNREAKTPAQAGRFVLIPVLRID